MKGHWKDYLYGRSVWVNRKEMRDILDASRAILKKAGIIDYVNDAKNLALALNHDHSLEYAKAVLKRLQKAVQTAKENR